jgi:hypothetical protein
MASAAVRRAARFFFQYRFHQNSRGTVQFHRQQLVFGRPAKFLRILPESGCFIGGSRAFSWLS